MNTVFSSVRRTLSIAGIAAFAVLTPAALSACSSPKPAAEASASTMAERASFTDAWVKVADAGGMSGAFGALNNTGTEKLVLTGASSERAGMIEIHEFVTKDGAQVMQEMQGEFTVAAGKDREFVPGGEHLMLMGLPSALLAGEELPLVLEFSDGSTLPVTLPVRDYSGANEVYGEDEGAEKMDHGSMDHGTMEHDSADAEPHADSE